MQTHVSSRTFRTAGAVLACAAFLAGCGSQVDTPKPPASKRAFPLGSAVVVGPLTYSALEVEWRDSLDGQFGQRLPKNRWMLVRMTVTNGGGADQTCPLLTVVDSKGETYLEDDKGEGVRQWLGLIRILKPAETLEGSILFDVPPGAYTLRVTTGGDPEREVTSNIEIPFRLDQGASTPK
jgi:hypothetical protein